MTTRLYYDDPYLFDFTARVTRCGGGDGAYEVYLDRSAFYPTSGGQPYDTGMIADANVLDVRVTEDGDVCHVTDRPVEGEVLCHIDRARRLDHMQQHAGEHLLAGELYHMYGAHTIGLHLGHDTSTIDCEMDRRPTQQEEEELERRVNARIQACDAIRQWFPAEEEMALLPLRKPPTVKEHIRVVLMGDYECCACGGPHPDNTGRIGFFKMVSVTPSRGKIRFEFVCGMRAVRYAARLQNEMKRAGEIFSTGVEGFAGAAEKMAQREKEAAQEIRELKDALYAYEAKEAAGNCVTTANGERACFITRQGTADELTRFADILVKQGISAFLENGNEKSDYVFACPEGSALDAGKLMKQACSATGGRGGGRANYARGGGPAGAVNVIFGILEA